MIDMFKWLFGKKEVKEVQERQLDKMSEYELEKAINSFNEQILENCNILQESRLSHEYCKQEYEYAINKYNSFRKQEECIKDLIEPLERVINDLKQADTHSKDLIVAYSDTDKTDIETYTDKLWDSMDSITLLIDEVEDLLYMVKEF